MNKPDNHKYIVGFLAICGFFLALASGAWAFDINQLIFNDLKDGGKHREMSRSGTLGDRGIQQLSKSRMLKKVEVLILKTHDITDEGLKALAESKFLKNVKVFNLSHNKVGPEGIQAIAQSENFKSITTLKLWGNHIGPEGIRALAASQALSRTRMSSA